MYLYTKWESKVRVAGDICEALVGLSVDTKINETLLSNFSLSYLDLIKSELIFYSCVISVEVIFSLYNIYMCHLLVKT